MPHKSQKKTFQSQRSRSTQAPGQSFISPMKNPSEIAPTPSLIKNDAAPAFIPRPATPKSAVYPNAKAALANARYPQVASELRHIVILTGVILVVLVILSFALANV